MTKNVLHTGMPLDEALTGENTVTACTARIAISAVPEELVKFMNAELDRGTETGVILTALALFFVQSHSSMAAQLAGPKTCQHMAETYEMILRNEYIAHAQRTRNNIKEAAAL